MASKKESPGNATQTSRQTTEVVYVVSPDWQHCLFASLRSLMASGTFFDGVVIYCVGKRPSHWNFEDPRILVEEVNPLIDGYFLINKTYLCRRPAERVIFLDADTMILKPLDSLYQNIQDDFIGRVAGQYQSKNWNRDEWARTLRSVKAKDTPYFNSGLIIFQNGAHEHVGPLWLDFTQKNLDGRLMNLTSARFAEQLALSLAVGAAHLSYHLLSRTEHAYGWRNEPYEGAVVFHSSGPFLPVATSIEKALGIEDLNLPVFRGASKFNSIRFHRRLRHLRASFAGLIKASMPLVARERMR